MHTTRKLRDRNPRVITVCLDKQLQVTEPDLTRGNTQTAPILTPVHCQKRPEISRGMSVNGEEWRRCLIVSDESRLQLDGSEGSAPIFSITGVLGAGTKPANTVGKSNDSGVLLRTREV